MRYNAYGDGAHFRDSTVLIGLAKIGKLELLREVKPLIEELRRKKFRISDRVASDALKRAGE